MKTKITKQVKKELKTLLDNHGYWSDEVRVFIEQFNYITAKILHQKAQAYDKYRMRL